MYILGISAYYHDSAAAILEDGIIRAAAQEERFTRKKGDSSFPHNAISYCLDCCGISENDIDHVVFYEDPKVKFERLLTSYNITAPSSWFSFISTMPSWITKKLWMESEINKEMGINKKIICGDHHMSHAASAFYPSPFESAAILTVDGVGEWSTATYGVGVKNKISLKKHIQFPNSVGLLYSAFTYYTGFKINSGEYKLMGLAPYGKPKYADLIKGKLIKINEDGSTILNQTYFNYVTGFTMTNKKFNKLFGKPPRKPESEITEFEMDIAASIQQVTNEIIFKMASHLYKETKQENLVMAGGVALNCVANGELLSNGPFKNIWIQPAAGDAGGALGAALWMWHNVLGNKREVNPLDSMQSSFLGPDIEMNINKTNDTLTKMGANWQEYDENELAERIAQEIANGKVISVARGRMEWGPRALGNRSILGDARSEKMQSHMNLKIKFRESFRPFAPMVLAEDANLYFDIKQESPYMLFVCPIQENKRIKSTTGENLFGLELLNQQRSDIPAVTHLDYSARVQTVDKERNPFIHSVISKFKEKTGCSVIINTSFNVRSEPIVNTAEDAYRCFMATEIDHLVIGNRFFDRNNQKNKPMTDLEREKWLRRFDLD